MRESLRPKGSVEVKCSHLGCNIYWWIDPLDPRLPDGPFDCGSTHEDDHQKQFDALVPLFGIRWGTRLYRGPRSDGKTSVSCGYGGQPAGSVLFQDKWGVKVGSLDYEDIQTLKDPLEIPKRIDWVKLSPHFKEGDPGTPDDGPLPRMGGTIYITQAEGGLKPMRLVLHKCPDCGRTCRVYETHPKAFTGPVSCSDEVHQTTSPCPVRNRIGIEFDAVLQKLHGPNVEWTMWEGLNQVKDSVKRYDRGLVLIRDLREHGMPFFSLLEYEHPNDLALIAIMPRWSKLDRIVTPKNISPEMKEKIEEASLFVV